MKRLICKKDNINIGDSVVWKKHPYDFSIYKVIEILPNGNLFIDNGECSYTDIKQSIVSKI